MNLVQIGPGACAARKKTISLIEILSYQKVMKIFLVASLLLTSPAFADWKNPSVLCPEEALPKGVTCLDLSRVNNPLLDFPSWMNEADVQRWTTQLSKDLKVCRAREVLRRETVTPGSYSSLQVQVSWMTANGGEKPEEKLARIIESANQLGMPPQILIGALTQESLMADLGISSDGGNYSCGIGQLNISEWCIGMNTLSAAERVQLKWPTMTCDTITPAMVAPFHSLALRNLSGRPEYRLEAKDFAGITLDQVVGQFPAATPAVQANRYKAIISFVNNCQSFVYGIPFKARNIKNLFTNFVPAKMKAEEVYLPSERYARTCTSSYQSKYYPLHTGWLLALAAYNAGPSITKLLEHYHQASGAEMPSLNPLDLIEALYWGGEVRVGVGGNRVYFTGANERTSSQSWYKSCVVQRHIARVIQHVTVPGTTIARSLEDSPCSQQVPASRRSSSGIKN